MNSTLVVCSVCVFVCAHTLKGNESIQVVTASTHITYSSWLSGINRAAIMEIDFFSILLLKN